MTADEIAVLEPDLAIFLGEFHDCFGRSEPRGKLGDFVRGQLSDLPRKSCEPVALWAGTAPRTLQEFLATDQWDHDRARDRIQQIVGRDHCDLGAIAILDDSGHPKKGKHTAGVARQYCGNTGKVDNCVVTVHLTYSTFDTSFHTMLDSTLYLPEEWNDPERRRAVGIPETVGYRPKYVIALEQLDRALANGLHFGWVTADEWYGEKPRFLWGLAERGQRFVVEVPSIQRCWTSWPGPAPQTKSSTVANLARYSRYLRQTPVIRCHVKDTHKEPVLWDVRAWPVWLCLDGHIVGPYWLLCATNVLNPYEEKFFLSNAAPGTPLEVLVHVAFARWPVERCLEDEKTELGMSHFEVRQYTAIQRHLLITQISHLFLARQALRLRKKKSGGHAVPGAHRRQRRDFGSRPTARPLPAAL